VKRQMGGGEGKGTLLNPRFLRLVDDELLELLLVFVGEFGEVELALGDAGCEVHV